MDRLKRGRDGERLRLVLDGKVEESEQSSLVQLGQVKSEHGDERCDGVGEQAPTLAGGLGETPNIASCLELGLGVGGLKEAKSSSDGRRSRQRGCLSFRIRVAHRRRVVHSWRQFLSVQTRVRGRERGRVRGERQRYSEFL